MLKQHSHCIKPTGLKPTKVILVTQLRHVNRCLTDGPLLTLAEASRAQPCLGRAHEAQIWRIYPTYILHISRVIPPFFPKEDTSSFAEEKLLEFVLSVGVWMKCSPLSVPSSKRWYVNKGVCTNQQMGVALASNGGTSAWNLVSLSFDERWSDVSPRWLVPLVLPPSRRKHIPGCLLQILQGHRPSWQGRHMSSTWYFIKTWYIMVAHGTSWYLCLHLQFHYHFHHLIVELSFGTCFPNQTLNHGVGRKGLQRHQSMTWWPWIFLDMWMIGWLCGAVGERCPRCNPCSASDFEREFPLMKWSQFITIQVGAFYNDYDSLSRWNEGN